MFICCCSGATIRKLAKRMRKKIFFRFFSKYTPNTFIINSKIFFPRRNQNSCRKGLNKNGEMRKSV